MTDRTLSRKAVRELVKINHTELAEAAQRGENIHQLALDQQDIIVEQHTEGMSPEEQARFFEMYAQESDALNAELEADTQKLIADTEKRGQEAELGGKIIGAIIIFILVIFALSQIN